jgi:NAD(P)-dependent dehydrogenase (short-subunit alcohol dehydrogenase family)
MRADDEERPSVLDGRDIARTTTVRSGARGQYAKRSIFTTPPRARTRARTSACDAEHGSVAGRLQGKVALISGGARGQGAAHGALFAEEGARVILGDVREEEGRRLAEELRSRGHAVAFTRLDVTSSANWERVVALAEDEHGCLDVLVNNAGIVAFASATETQDDEWERVLGVNQTGMFYGMRAAIPALRRAGGGSIVNISSTLAVGAIRGYFAYQATKAAIVMMTRAAAVEYASDGIRVNSILPGLIHTEMTLEEPEDAVKGHIALTPLGRGGTPREISLGALYLASDESSFVTGTELVIDGGYLAQ